MTKHQNQTLKGFMLCFSMALLASCQESELIKPQADDLTMSVVANISPVGSVTQSRYAGSEPNLVEFAEGDAIGIFVDSGEPVQWTYGTSGWSAEDIVYSTCTGVVCSTCGSRGASGCSASCAAVTVAGVMSCGGAAG